MLARFSTVAGNKGSVELARDVRGFAVKFSESPPLSIIKNGPHSFAGRKLGVLVTDGADGSIFDAIQAGAKKHGALVEVVARHIGGFTDSGGRAVEAGQKIDGGPSVLYAAVALLLSDEGATKLAANPPPRTS